MQKPPTPTEATMIKPQDKVFANLIAHLHRDLPLEPLTRLVNLAAVALGILRSKSLQVGQIITALPLAGTRDTLKKRGQRFLKNPSVTVELYHEPAEPAAAGHRRSADSFDHRPDRVGRL